MAMRARDDEFQALFGDCTDAEEIEQIKNNDPALDEFSPADVDDLTDAAWQKLGSYMAGNDYLREIDLSNCDLDTSRFRGLLMGGAALRRITGFWCRRNSIDSTCFDLLLDAMDGGAIKELNFGSNRIQNPEALARCTLPKLQNLWLDGNGITDLPSFAKLTHLQSLTLSGNKLGVNGFSAIGDMLRNEGCSWKYLHLQACGMNNTGATILAESLKCNTKLKTLGVSGNRIGDKGMGAFLKLLNNVSSIKNTERSNHTLLSLGFFNEEIRLSTGVMAHVHRDALDTNIEHQGNPEAAGKLKVLRFTLYRRCRQEFARLQGIECPSYHQLFSDLDAVLLPNILELVGRHNDGRNENELYPAIVARASDLVSLIDREAMLRGEKAKNVARIAAITAELARLNDVNSRIDSQLSSSIEVEERNSNLSGNKRGRDVAA